MAGRPCLRLSLRHLPSLVGEVLREKALTVLVDAATITDSNGEAVDLKALESAEA